MPSTSLVVLKKFTNEQMAADFEQRVVRFCKREETTCLFCDKEVTSIRKAGKIAYAVPCGCKLWKGPIPAHWR